MSYGDFYFLSMLKSHSSTKKEAELNVFRPLHIFCLIKILILQSFQSVFQYPRW